MQINLGATAKTPGVAPVKDTDELHFERDVLTASMTHPVIVTFWAAWSAPCKQMIPALEKAVRETAGAVLMAKVNLDKNPGLVQALNIQSAPTVYAFFQGKPVDGFAGDKTALELQAFVGKLKALASPPAETGNLAEHVKKIMSGADVFFQQGLYQEAMAQYSSALEMDPESMDSLGGIGWCLLMLGDIADVREMLAQLTPVQLKSSRLKGLQFLLSLQVDSLEDISVLEQKCLKDKKNLQALFDLSQRFLAAGLLEKGMETLITIIRHDRDWQEKKARVFLLELLDALGPVHPLTSPARRKLSAVLFS